MKIEIPLRDKLALSIPEAAQMIGSSVPYINECIARRELPAIKLGTGSGNTKIKAKDLKEFIENKEYMEITG